MNSRVALGAAVIAAVVALSGCVTEPPEPTPSATTSPTPLFSSDAEALAAAEKAYAEFQAMEDLIRAESGAEPDRIRNLATRDMLEGALESFEEYRERGISTTGRVTFDTVSVGAIDPFPSSGLDAVTMLACIDTSKTDVVDQAGNSIVPLDRSERQQFELVFDVVDAELRLASRRLISDDPC